MDDATPGDRLRRGVARLRDLLAPFLKRSPEPDETISGFGVIDACGHVYSDNERPYISRSALCDLMLMNVERARRLRDTYGGVHLTRKAPGCPECMLERHEQKLGIVRERQN